MENTLPKYKENGSHPFGISDVAALTMVAYSREQKKIIAESIGTGRDGSYRAYFTDGDAEIPEHYKLVFQGNCWLKVYDDIEKVADIGGEVIKVYQAASGTTFIVAVEKC